MHPGAVSSDESQVDTGKSPTPGTGQTVPVPGVNGKPGVASKPPPSVPGFTGLEPLPLPVPASAVGALLFGVPGLLPEQAGSVSPPAMIELSAPAPYTQRIPLMNRSSAAPRPPRRAARDVLGTTTGARIPREIACSARNASRQAPR